MNDGSKLKILMSDSDHGNLHAITFCKDRIHLADDVARELKDSGLSYYLNCESTDKCYYTGVMTFKAFLQYSNDLIRYENSIEELGDQGWLNDDFRDIRIEFNVGALFKDRPVTKKFLNDWLFQNADT